MLFYRSGFIGNWDVKTLVSMNHAVVSYGKI